MASTPPPPHDQPATPPSHHLQGTPSPPSNSAPSVDETFKQVERVRQKRNSRQYLQGLGNAGKTADGELEFSGAAAQVARARVDDEGVEPSAAKPTSRRSVASHAALAALQGSGTAAAGVAGPAKDMFGPLLAGAKETKCGKEDGKAAK